jgi:CubicO group peptidase (beta-lactamase class C family)
MNRVGQVVTQHLETYPIPGAAWGIGLAGQLEFDCAGRLWHTSDAPSVTLETVWDLASLTKVLVTAPLLLRLWQTGQLDLDAPLKDILPEVRGHPLGTATVKQLASHSAGLAALSKLRYWHLPRDAALRKALEEPRPQTSITYSDQGFIVLTYLLEKLYGSRLDRIAQRELFAPCGVGLTYHPDADLCAATELDAATGELLRGHVHDENTRALEGISGHAGLFGSVSDVARYLEGLIGGRVLNTAALRVMGAELARDAGDARAFGWVLRHDDWLGGNVAPDGALGHTGFTGTGAWLSLETGQINVLLTNRVCPSRHGDSQIAELRRAFNDAAWGSTNALTA